MLVCNYLTLGVFFSGLVLVGYFGLFGEQG